jgi:diadenosine tetraphosphate (Ap4A) HIT family hydrolase
VKRFPDCLLCAGLEGDDQMHRVQVWEDGLWRLTTSIAAEVEGFSYLEPKRHIAFITDLDGDEARTLGGVLARATSALREATGAPFVYIYVFGDGISHLHFMLGPHRPGDALNDSMIRGEVKERRLPSGATLLESEQFPSLPEAELRAAAGRIRALLD